MNQLRRNLAQYSPRMISSIFYRMALKSFETGVQVYGGRTHAQVWARNSYRQGNWIPFQSDIDLSIWLAKEPALKDLERLRKTHATLKRVFPVLGEMNLYVATDTGWIEKLVNCFELERDPQLAKKVSYKGSLDVELHAASFLLRMLESDIERVLNEPEGRRAKWNAHFKRVTELAGGAELDIWNGFPQRTLLRGILDLVSFILKLPEEDKKAFTEQLELYFQSVGHKVPVYVLRPLLAQRPFLWAAFPHRFCFQTESRPVLQGRLAELAEAQLSWELFGMLTQHRLWRHSESERAAIRAHLESLGDFYRQCVRGRPTGSGIPEALEHLLRAL